MSYTLWSHGRLVGHTELDVPHVQDQVRLGFIEPTADGEHALSDVTCVGDAILAFTRASRRLGEDAPEARTAEADVRAAFDRREAVHLELRDATDRAIAVRWIQVTDLRAAYMSDGAYDLASDEVIFGDIEADLASLSAADDTDIDALLGDNEALWDDVPAGEWTPADERWDTMRYYIMVHLRSATDLP